MAGGLSGVREKDGMVCVTPSPVLRTDAATQYGACGEVLRVWQDAALVMTFGVWLVAVGSRLPRCARNDVRWGVLGD